MTKKHILNALIVSAFLTMTACGGGSGGSDSSSLDNTQSQQEEQGALQDDVGDEGTFDSSAQSENDLTDLQDISALALSEKEAILKKYNHLDPKKEVPTTALANALIYFDKNKSKIRNKTYVSVIDFSKKSTLKRFFIINMSTGKVLSLHVAHGKGSDSNHDGYAEKFSNTPGSKASSIGYYLTGSTYYGGNGLSLRLDGLSSTNSKARGRAIVIHGASYVSERNVIQGRSWGCPAVAMSYRTEVINKLKNGSLIYAVK